MIRRALISFVIADCNIDDRCFPPIHSHFTRYSCLGIHYEINAIIPTSITGSRDLKRWRFVSSRHRRLPSRKHTLKDTGSIDGAAAQYVTSHPRCLPSFASDVASFLPVEAAHHHVGSVLIGCCQLDYLLVCKFSSVSLVVYILRMYTCFGQRIIDISPKAFYFYHLQTSLCCLKESTINSTNPSPTQTKASLHPSNCKHSNKSEYWRHQASSEHDGK